MLFPDNILDGYRLIRPIGIGGFGEVWLCRAEATGEWRALKFVPALASRHLVRELEALISYRAVAVKLQCPSLLPIEHINRNEHGLYYVMPLADGLHGDDPCAGSWQPKTLAALIEDRRSAPVWFSAQEVLEMIVPLLHAVQRLSDAGIVHRDIKPENILVVGGQPALADISLLGNDARTLTQRGTPGYAPASWYLETGGNPDLWGMACTLYTLLSGNAPDKIGRAVFLWPPQGEASVDKAVWYPWHQVVLRAIADKPAERFLRFEDMAAAIATGDARDFPKTKAPARSKIWFVSCVLAFLVAGGWGGWHFWKAKHPPIVQQSPMVGASLEASEKIAQVGIKAEQLFAAFKKESAACCDDTPLKPAEVVFVKVKKILEGRIWRQVSELTAALVELEQCRPAFSKGYADFWDATQRRDDTKKALKNYKARTLESASTPDEHFKLQQIFSLHNQEIEEEKSRIEEIAARWNNAMLHRLDLPKYYFNFEDQRQLVEAMKKINGKWPNDFSYYSPESD